jgi:hypothetical protein
MFYIFQFLYCCLTTDMRVLPDPFEIWILRLCFVHFVWPETIVKNIFVKYNILKKHFTILKLDVDSYECSILEHILRANYRPQTIHSECNPIYPPPVIFMPIYNSTTKNDWIPPL